MDKICFITRQKDCVLMQYMIYASLIICLFAVGCASKEIAAPTMSTEPAVALLLTPAETTTAEEPVEFSIIGFDANGKQTSAIETIEWMLTGLTGTLEDNKFTPDKSAGAQAGTVSIQSGDLKATSRIRVIPSPPWTEDFESAELEKAPAHWISATGKYFVREKDGNKVLVKTPVQRGLNKSNVYFGSPTMKTIRFKLT